MGLSPGCCDAKQSTKRCRGRTHGGWGRKAAGKRRTDKANYSSTSLNVTHFSMSRTMTLYLVVVDQRTVHKRPATPV